MGREFIWYVVRSSSPNNIGTVHMNKKKMMQQKTCMLALLLVLQVNLS